ncbi:MAG: apolipoprotein N-acyltransferase, partial [Helicobacter sp.]|nr:apolipoprotein N-acyltransferase [Helicobacter sp.]
ISLYGIYIFIPNISIIPPKPPLKIKTIQTNIPQDLRWQEENLQNIINLNFELITQAIQENYDLIILPETAFPLVLNHHPKLMQTLRDKSQNITILTGAIHEDKGIYNSAYLFKKGEVQIFHKIILVPFGEKIPLPSFLVNFINHVFFQDKNDFTPSTNKTPNSALINGEKFHIAICYEATREEFYESNPKFLLALSNNAWFNPSIESTLQKLLMLYFAKNHGTTIYHSSNASASFILSP